MMNKIADPSLTPYGLHRNIELNHDSVNQTLTTLIKRIETLEQQVRELQKA